MNVISVEGKDADCLESRKSTHGIQTETEDPCFRSQSSRSL